MTTEFQPDQIGKTEGRVNVSLPECWRHALESEFQKSYMNDLRDFLKSELKRGKQIFPQPKEYFAALNLTPLDEVKVVVLGQDPYHGPGQAHGLSFSVREGVALPPSLQNIYKELSSDLGVPITKNGDLSRWAKQGVLLLNATLSVELSKAGSHQGRGWEQFTDEIVNVLNRERENLVFILWGSYAQKKGSAIDSKRHLVIKCPHPSPLSAHRGFFGSRPFSKTNSFLLSKRIAPIEW
ncbi:MAG: uracil-DNA glycosylase [Bdellovibrionales bacterium CG10_big_fil_rev_8_21_14_0_10_45_34]|nr:MAG: uracil-DNA glycosylase [Bdellovibrionales bacterium CG10_big_fil_rev_8_21_14_0_10_45_34]